MISASMLAGFARLDSQGAAVPTREWIELRCQPPQNFFPQLLRFAEKFLVLDEHPIQFDRLLRRQLMAQQHVSYVDRIWQGRFFVEFFKGGRGIVVIHAGIVCRSEAVSRTRGARR